MFMSFNEYQEKAKGTAVYPDSLKVIYPTLGLAGETGEVCEKVKKVVRDNNGVFENAKKEEIILELGDVLWYVANVAADLGIALEEVAGKNLLKLANRKQRGVLHGNGDNR